MPVTNASLDFGYPWWLSYGHLVILLPVLCLLALGYWLKWRKWAMLLLGALALWSGGAFVVMRYGFNINRPPSLLTENFLPSGRGRVLDLGAGTGRSSIMVL